MVREIKRIKPPGPAWTGLQKGEKKKTPCNLSFAPSEASFITKLFEEAPLNSVAFQELYLFWCKVLKIAYKKSILSTFT